MTTTIEMRMQTRIVPPEVTVVIMTATYAMNMVMPQMRQPVTTLIKVTATSAVPMPYRKRNPCTAGIVVPAARSMTMRARVVMPTPTVVMVPATRSMNMLMLQIKMSDSRRPPTVPILRAMLNLRSNGRRLRRHNRSLRLNTISRAWTIVRDACDNRISLNLAALRGTLIELPPRIAIDILRKRPTFPINSSRTRNLRP